MINFSTSKMTSKGQVVIPKETRKRLGMKPGTQFMVLESNDAVVFKVINPPSLADFGRLLAESRRQAQKTGLKKSDIEKAIQSAREEKKKP